MRERFGRELPPVKQVGPSEIRVLPAIPVADFGFQAVKNAAKTAKRAFWCYPYG